MTPFEIQLAGGLRKGTGSQFRRLSTAVIDDTYILVVGASKMHQSRLTSADMWLRRETWYQSFSVSSTRFARGKCLLSLVPVYIVFLFSLPLSYLISYSPVSSLRPLSHQPLSRVTDTIHTYIHTHTHIYTHTRSAPYTTRSKFRPLTALQHRRQ